MVAQVMPIQKCLRPLAGIGTGAVERAGSVVFVISSATFVLTLPVWLYLRHVLEKRKLSEAGLINKLQLLMRNAKGDFPWPAFFLCSLSGYFLYKLAMGRSFNSEYHHARRHHSPEEEPSYRRGSMQGDARRALPKPLLLSSPEPDCDSCAEAEEDIRQADALPQQARQSQSNCGTCQDLSKNRLERNESARERRRRGTSNMTVTPPTLKENYADRKSLSKRGNYSK